MIGIGATLFKRAVMGSRGFSPSALFANGEEGGWYDPSDLSTLFEEDGTTPASVDGPVGKILDKSGNGNHLIQTTETKCPTLKLAGGLYYLEFDGADDGLASASIDFSSSDSMSVFVGVRKEVDETAVVAEISDNAGINAGAFRFGSVTGDRWRYSIRNSSTLNLNATGYTSPQTNVVTSLNDFSDPIAKIRVDGSEVNSATSSAGSGNFGDYPLNVGARGSGSSLFLEGRIYSLIVRNVLSNADELASTEKYVATKTGVSI